MSSPSPSPSSRLDIPTVLAPLIQRLCDLHESGDAVAVQAALQQAITAIEHQRAYRQLLGELLQRVADLEEAVPKAGNPASQTSARAAGTEQASQSPPAAKQSSNEDAQRRREYALKLQLQASDNLHELSQKALQVMARSLGLTIYRGKIKKNRAELMAEIRGVQGVQGR